MDLEEKVKGLPSCPGVYLMKDSLGNIIYVGKSKNLKSRIGSYFNNNKNRTSKVEKLIKNIRDFDFITVDTELEALIMECKLIKALKPRYNKLMKSDLKYPYIKVTVKDKYPILKLCYMKSDDGNLYYGPFTNYNNLYNIINFLMDELPLKKCNIQISNKATSTCLNYELKKCFGVCKYDQYEKEYKASIYKILDFLCLKNDELIVYLSNKMKSYSDNLDFEKAQYLLDNIEKLLYLKYQLENIETLKNKKKLLIMETYSNKMKVFFVNGNDILFTAVYNINNVKMNEIKMQLNQKLVDCIKEIKLNCTNIYQRDEDEKSIIDEYSIIYRYLKTKGNNSLTFVELKDDFKIRNTYIDEIDVLLKNI